MTRFSGRGNDAIFATADLIQRHSTATAHARQVLSTMIGELTQNVTDHAESQGVISARFLSGSNRVVVVVADFGVGLEDRLGRAS